MGSKTIPVLLVTANVGSIFENPVQMLKIWADEFLSNVVRLDPKFVALHCQEVGGKNYEKSMKHVENFVHLLMSSNELRLFDRVRVFLDEDYSSAENFTALGSFYFIHESIDDILIFNFDDLKFIPVSGKEIHSGNIESVLTKEKSKFPQDFFPECKWSRKGFLRTRWSISGTIFDLINIHLFHDASNFVAMETFPSVYCANRRRALEHTLQRFHNDTYGKAPYFLFGDFNFRTDTEGVIKKLTDGLTTTRVHNNKNNDHTKLQYVNDESQLILTVGKKEFNHLDHQTIFLNTTNCWLKSLDKELDAFKNHLTEYPVTFPPSYPFEESISHAAKYMLTRCPAWCDRVLLSHTAKPLVCETGHLEYGLMGRSTCMGDHKPVYLRADLVGNAGTITCCTHVPYECLPVLCRCCQSFASVTINVTDTSDYVFNSRQSFETVTVDSNFLHEPITKDMLTHDPYTPESAESHSPKIKKTEIETPEKRISISPYELKTKLENILRLENACSKKFLMKRSASQGLYSSKPRECFRDRSMSEVPRKNARVRLISNTSTLSNRLQSHHSSSDEDWFEYDDQLESPTTSRDIFILQVANESVLDKVSTEVDDLFENSMKEKHAKNNCVKSKVHCCSIF